MAVHSLLNFGSGYARHLSESDGCGDKTTEEQILFGMLSLHISGSTLDTACLEALQTEDLTSAMSLKTHVPADSGLPGTVLMKPGPLLDWAAAMVTSLQTTSSRMRALGLQRLSEFILGICRPVEAAGQRPRAAPLVAALAAAFPAFQDSVEVVSTIAAGSSSGSSSSEGGGGGGGGVGGGDGGDEEKEKENLNGSPVDSDESASAAATTNATVSKTSTASMKKMTVPFTRKAQHLAAQLYHAFGETDAARFDFEDVDQLAASDDPTLLHNIVRLGLVRLPADLVKRMRAKSATREGLPEDPALRACQIVACDALAKKLGISPRAVAAAIRDLAPLDLSDEAPAPFLRPASLHF